MSKSFKYISLISLLTLFVSCSEEIGGDDRYGYLTVGVSDELGDIVEMKSDADEIVYSLEILDENGNVDAYVEDHRTVSEEAPIKLLMGKYNVSAVHGEPGTAFNSPCYSGSNSVRIFADKSASVNIDAKMGKVKFSVHFPEDESFADKFSLYELIVSNGTKLTFSSSPKTDDPSYGTFRDTAYFEVPADKILTYTLRVVNKDGAEYVSSDKISDVAAAEHYHLDFKLGEVDDIDGALVLNIVLDSEYDVVRNHEIRLNFDKGLMPSYSTNAEFLPVPDDGSTPVYPLGNDITKRFTFSAPRGIRSLVISHLDANLLTEGLPQVTDLAGISEADLQILTDIGVSAQAVTEGAVEATIDITEFVKNLSISPDNEPYRMSLTVIDEYDRYARCDFEFAIVSDIQAETVSAFTWSSFSILKGRFFSRTAPEGISFQYKKKSDAEWIEIEDEMDIDLTTLTYSYRLNHLDVNTEYVFRATSLKDKTDGKVAGEIGFKTFASESMINNLSLDDWYKDGDAWYPNASSSSSDWVWDTANGGTAMLGCYPTNPDESVLAVTGSGKKAAKMVSQVTSGMIKKFAAGNIYTGKFFDISMTPAGAMLDWGLSFNSRPLALRGWYRYEPKAINQAGDGYEYLKGQMDNCHIQIFLTDWTGMFRINAYTDFSKSRYVDFNADYILAHGEMITDNNTTDDADTNNGYLQFTIPLKYRSLKDPSFIVVSGAASRYGDYFTGGEGSTLYLDELELIYDPDQLSDEEFDLVMEGIR